MLFEGTLTLDTNHVQQVDFSDVNKAIARLKNQLKSVTVGGSGVDADQIVRDATNAVTSQIDAFRQQQATTIQELADEIDNNVREITSDVTVNVNSILAFVNKAKLESIFEGTEDINVLQLRQDLDILSTYITRIQQQNVVQGTQSFNLLDITNTINQNQAHVSSIQDFIYTVQTQNIVTGTQAFNLLSILNDLIQAKADITTILAYINNVQTNNILNASIPINILTLKNLSEQNQAQVSDAMAFIHEIQTNNIVQTSPPTNLATLHNDVSQAKLDISTLLTYISEIQTNNTIQGTRSFNLLDLDTTIVQHSGTISNILDFVDRIKTDSIIEAQENINILNVRDTAIQNQTNIVTMNTFIDDIKTNNIVRGTQNFDLSAMLATLTQAESDITALIAYNHRIINENIIQASVPINLLTLQTNANTAKTHAINAINFINNVTQNDIISASEDVNIVTLQTDLAQALQDIQTLSTYINHIQTTNVIQATEEINLLTIKNDLLTVISQAQSAVNYMNTIRNSNVIQGSQEFNILSLQNSVNELSTYMNTIKQNHTITTNDDATSLNIPDVNNVIQNVNNIIQKLGDLSHSILNNTTIVNLLNDLSASAGSSVDIGSLQLTSSNITHGSVTLAEKLNDVDTLIDTHTSKIATVEQTASNLNTQIANNITSINEHTTAIDAVQQTAFNLNTQIANNIDTLTSHATQLQSITSSVQSNTIRLDELTAKDLRGYVDIVIHDGVHNIRSLDDLEDVDTTYSMQMKLNDSSYRDVGLIPFDSREMKHNVYTGYYTGSDHWTINENRLVMKSHAEHSWGFTKQYLEKQLGKVIHMHEPWRMDIHIDVPQQQHQIQILFSQPLELWGIETRWSAYYNGIFTSTSGWFGHNNGYLGETNRYGITFPNDGNSIYTNVTEHVGALDLGVTASSWQILPHPKRFRIEMTVEDKRYLTIYYDCFVDHRWQNVLYASPYRESSFASAEYTYYENRIPFTFYSGCSENKWSYMRFQQGGTFSDLPPFNLFHMSPSSNLSDFTSTYNFVLNLGGEGTIRYNGTETVNFPPHLFDYHTITINLIIGATSMQIEVHSTEIFTEVGETTLQHTETILANRTALQSYSILFGNPFLSVATNLFDLEILNDQVQEGKHSNKEALLNVIGKLMMALDRK